MQLGIAPTEWTYELLLRIKHRFGVSAEAFAHRLEEVGVLDKSLRQDLKAQIKRHYDAPGYQEPDNSCRILSRNGRFGDLLLCAARNASPTERIEVQRLRERFTHNSPTPRRPQAIKRGAL